MKLNPTTEKFILHWGEMGTKWGVNRTVAQIHALLYIVGEPMNAEEICQTLNVARSNVSNSIKELQNWQLIQTAPILGDRREHFTTSDDVWALFKTIILERQRRELEPTVQFLEQLMQSDSFANENPAMQKRVKDTHELLDTMCSWSRKMLVLPSKTLNKIIKLGTGILKFLG